MADLKKTFDIKNPLVTKQFYDFDGNKGYTYRIEFETELGKMSFKIEATTNEKLLLNVIALDISK